MATQLAATRCKLGSINPIQLIEISLVESEYLKDTEIKLLRDNGYTFTLKEDGTGDVLIYAYAYGVGVAPADMISIYIEDKVRDAIFRFIQTSKPLYNEEGCKRIGSIADNAIENEKTKGLITELVPTQVSYRSQNAEDIKKGRVAGIVYGFNIAYTIWYTEGQIKGVVEA